MLGNKHAFWQALIVALLIFWAGILLGIMFEQSRAEKLKNFYYGSETEIFDMRIQQELLRMSNVSCAFVAEQSIRTADRIYEEARQLEKYDASSKVTEDVRRLHTRYDLLRVMLWEALQEHQQRCKEEFNVIVYLYQYDNPSVGRQAQQTTMSKVLLDLKKKYGDGIVLIPLAYDSGIRSLEVLREHLEIRDVPVVVINDHWQIHELQRMEELEKYLYR